MKCRIKPGAASAARPLQGFWRAIMDMQASDNQPLWPPEKLDGAQETRSGSAECVGAKLEGV